MTVDFLVEAEQSNGTMTLQRVDVPAGHGMPVAHSHDAFEETVYGLSGTLTLVVDGERVAVRPGDAVCIPRGTVHSFMAESGDASVLAISTPGVFGAAYFHELAAVLESAAGGPPDLAEMAAVMRRHGLTPAPPAAG